MADTAKNSFIVVLPNQIITIPQDSNLAWLPLFYALPKELVIKRKDYLEIPRNPYEVLYTDKYDYLINDDVFLQLIWESYAWSVWQFIQVPRRDGYGNIPGKWTDYSGDFPLWRMISVLSAVAEIERENIRVQTMEGRIQKAREGKWNGGFAPYGYTLEKGELKINEEEAEAIRIIFDKYVNTDMGCTGIAKYLDDHGIEKKRRQNGKNPLFVATLIRRILKNRVYCGKIAYGRRKTEKIHGTRSDYHLVEQDDYLLVDGLHEPIVSGELWHDAQVKILAMAKKYEKVNNGKENKIHLLTGLLKCPICGAGMYGNKSIKHKSDGTKYKDFYYYGCKHRDRTRGHKCDYKKQIHEELLDDTVAEVISKLVNNPKFSALMQKKITMKVDTSAIEQEIANHEKQLRQSYSVKSRLIEEIDTLDPDDKHYIKRKADLDDRLYKMYDKIEDTENLLIAARAKKTAIEAEKLTADNIHKVLIYFDKLYAVMDEYERRKFMESLVSEVHVYEERKPNGQ